MERLTFKKKENDPYVHGKAYVTCNVKGCLSITCEADPPCERMQEVVDRLYDFENIFGDDYDLDAAVSDIETVMAYGGANVDTCQFCKNGQCYARGGTKLCLPKWRGSEVK